MLLRRLLLAMPLAGFKYKLEVNKKMNVNFTSVS